MTRSFAFLVDPAAGGGAAPRAVVPLARLLRDAGATVEVTYSPGPRATADLVEAAVVRGDVVVAVGGDALVERLAGPVARLGGTLATVPQAPAAGSDPAAYARLLLEGEPRLVDEAGLTLRLLALGPRSPAAAARSRWWPRGRGPARR